MPSDEPQTEPVLNPKPKKFEFGFGRSELIGLVIKIVLLSVVDALAIFVIFSLVLQEDWVMVAIASVAVVILNWIYLAPDRKSKGQKKHVLGGRIAAKYLAPGVFFLLLFQVFVVGFSGYIAFTNYGDGHTGTKQDAINVINLTSQKRVPDSPSYRLSIVESFGTLNFLVTSPDGRVFIGAEEQPLSEVFDAELDSTGKAVSLPNFRTLQFGDILANQLQISQLKVPFSDDINLGSLRTADGNTAYVYLSDMYYDDQQDSFTNTTTGITYYDRGNGGYESDSGAQLTPGWKIEVGLKNFERAFGDESIRGPLIEVVIWTFAFAFLSVATTFALGLFLAIVFNDKRMKGKKIYRIIMILPYAFPSFLSGLVWMGLLNQDFGFINQVLFGGADIPWLTDEWLAKFSVLLVNLWLGFPYMFLVTTGALQSIPDELVEAAKVDGASSWTIFRMIKFPLLLISVAPLLISSFAFNFNNFNVIYMLTKGGPRDISAGVDVGATDLLITMVYKVAFGQGTGRDYGLASAFAILIFLIVAVVSIISFRQTKALEEMN